MGEGSKISMFPFSVGKNLCESLISVPPVGTLCAFADGTDTFWLSFSNCLTLCTLIRKKKMSVSK